MVVNIDGLAEDVREYVFLLMDSQPGFTGEEAGKIAAAVEAAFRAAIAPMVD
jgi:hypothetical protein